jgi:D-aminoacyl-tRNA deacylase
VRCIIQRVSQASVTIEKKCTAKIGKGMLVLAGFEETDTEEDISWMSQKISKLRLFSDEGGLMNLSLAEINGDVIVVSQFTLHAAVKKGNRPSFIRAAKPDHAIPFYEKFIADLKAELNKNVQSGVFGADMQVELINDGPVTIYIDSKAKE